MEPFTVLVKEASHISREKIQVGFHVAPQGTLWGKQLPHEFYVDFWFFIYRKVAARFFQTRLRLFCRQRSMYFWSQSLEKAVLLENRRQSQTRGFRISIAEYLAVFDFFFLQNYSFTPFCRRFHCWYRDPSSWASVVGRSNPELGRSSQPECSSGSVVCTLINLGLPSYLAQLLVKPLQILFLSQEFNFLVAPVLALSRH